MKKFVLAMCALTLTTAGCSKTILEFKREALFIDDPNSPVAFAWVYKREGIFHNDFDALQSGVISRERERQMETVTYKDPECMKGSKCPPVVLEKATGPLIDRYSWTPIGEGYFGSPGLAKGVLESLLWGAAQHSIAAGITGGGIFEKTKIKSNINTGNSMTGGDTTAFGGKGGRGYGGEGGTGGAGGAGGSSSATGGSASATGGSASANATAKSKSSSKNINHNENSWGWGGCE